MQALSSFCERCLLDPEGLVSRNLVRKCVCADHVRTRCLRVAETNLPKSSTNRNQVAARQPDLGDTRRSLCSVRSAVRESVLPSQAQSRQPRWQDPPGQQSDWGLSTRRSSRVNSTATESQTRSEPFFPCQDGSAGASTSGVRDATSMILSFASMISSKSGGFRSVNSRSPLRPGFQIIPGPGADNQRRNCSSREVGRPELERKREG